MLVWALAAAMTTTTGAIAPTTDTTSEPQDAASAPPDEATRNAEIERALKEDARQSRLWYTGWAAFYTIATGFSMKVALDSDDRDRRVSSAVDGIRSSLGLFTTVLFVPPSLAMPRLAEGDAAAPEEWLKKAADAERLGRSWLSHLANAAVNAAGGGYLWLHEHRFGAGLLAFLSGTAIGELKIWTQPTTALDAHRSLHPAPQTAQISITPLVSSGSFALAVDGRF